MNIQYRTSDGELGSFDAESLKSIEVDGHTFTITRRHYGYDEYDYWESEIKDVIEIRV